MSQKKHPIGAAAAIASLLVVAPSWGQSLVPITNASFEDQILSEGAEVSPVSGWTDIVGGGTAFNPSTTQYAGEAPTGDNVASFFGRADGDGLAQILVGPTGQFQADASYTLTVEVGDPSDGDFDGYVVQLLAGGTLLAEDDNSIVPVDGAFATSTVNYVYDAGSHSSLVGDPLEIRLSTKGASSGETNFDDVQLTVTLANSIANPGGPYSVPSGSSLSLDGSNSIPADGESITAWSWDLNNDGTFGDVTGETPVSISDADLTSIWGMASGDNTIQLQVTDSGGGTATATGTVTLSAALVYEPFDYPAGGLNGQGGTSDFGLDGTWSANAASFVIDQSLFGSVERLGGSIGGLQGSVNRFGGARTISSSALAGNQLLDDGATLWFSAEMGYDGGNATNTTLAFSLANNTFSGSNFDYGINDDGAQKGEGLGVYMGRTGLTNGTVIASHFRSAADFGNGFAPVVRGSWEAAGTPLGGTENGLVVGKIVWGAVSDTIELYQPDDQLNLGPVVSTLTVDVDQSTFDTITWARGDKVALDEIRFGGDYASVAPPDVTLPAFVSLSPADEAAGVLVNSNLVVTFDEPIAPGTGFITLQETGVGAVESFEVGVSANLTFGTSSLTISPTNPLNTNTAYHVLIDATAVEDANQNAFPGFSDADDWNFTSSSDGTAPLLASVSPLTSATGVDPAGNLVATFNEDIAAGSGSIILLNLTESTQTVYAITDPEISISGTDLTIDPVSDLDPGDQYAIQLDAGVVEDLFGNPFAGVVDPDVSTWTFTVTPDTTAPVIDTLSPGNGDSDVSPFASLVLSFVDQESIVVGSGLIEVRELGTDALIQSIDVAGPEVTLTGSKEATITATLVSGSSLYVTVAAGTFEDLSGNAFAGINDDTTWSFTTETLAPAGPGAISIYTTAAAGESLTTSDLVHTFDTFDRLSESHSLADGTDIVMEAGHHLVIYNSQFDTSSGSNRSEIQTSLNLNGVDLASGWSQGYIRRDTGLDEAMVGGGAVIDVATSGDILQLQSFRTDSNTGAGVVRANNSTGIQLLKLDDNWDYLRLAGHDGSGTDQAVPTGQVVWAPVTYQQELENDTGSFGFAATDSEITLKTAGRYLVLANTYATETTVLNRTEILQRLTLDGTAVAGSFTSSYIRGADGTDDGCASVGMIINTVSPNQVLEVEMAQSAGLAGMLAVGERTGLTIVKLPDSASYISLVEDSSVNGAQNLNAGSLPTTEGNTLLFNDPGAQIEVSAAFTHDTTTNPGQVGVTSTGDYLFLSSHFNQGAPPANAVGAFRGHSVQGWNVNGSARSIYGQNGEITREAGTTSDEMGTWTGFLVSLSDSDYVEIVSGALGGGGTTEASGIALQGVNIESLFAVVPDNAYDTWSGGFAGLSDPDPSVDFDGGGLATGIEWVVGGDPTNPTDDSGLLPTLDTTTSPGNALFVFRQVDAAGADANTSITVEYGSDLSGWSDAVDSMGGVSITVDEDGFATGVDKVTVSLPTSLAVDGKLFVRLNVNVASP